MAFLVVIGRSVIIAQLWRPEVARYGNLNNFCVFWEKWSLAVKFLKVCSNSFHRDNDRRCVQISWNVADWKSAKSCVIYLTKKFRLPLKLSPLHGSRQKSARASPPLNNVLTALHISSKSVHFRRSYSRTREQRFFCPVEYFHYRLFEPIIVFVL